MNNPIREFRTTLGMSVATFASALGVGVQTVYQAEAGTALNLTSSMRAGLLAIGVNPDVMGDRYRAYREHLEAENRRAAAEAYGAIGD